MAAAARLEQTGSAGGIFTDELFTQDAGHARVYLPVRYSPALDGTGARWQLPAGRFAVALHGDVDRTYAALGTWAAEHGRDRAGTVRERYLADPSRPRTSRSGGRRSAGRWLADPGSSGLRRNRTLRNVNEHPARPARPGLVGRPPDHGRA